MGRSIFADTTTQFYCFFAFISFTLLSHGLIAAVEDTSDNQAVNIGAIVNVDSRVGRENKVAMEIAIGNINNSPDNKYKLVLHVRDSNENPLQAASAADELTKNQKVPVILGMGTWKETVLVAQVGKQAQVPVISLAAAGINSQLTLERWPFLVQMANDESVEIRCVAAIIHSYGWRRVIVIDEDDDYGATSGTITLLSEALQEVGSKIEYRMVLPPFSSVSDPKAAVRKELEKMKGKQSRVFIIVRSSLSLAAHLFKEAKCMGMMGRDSVWITTTAVTNLLDTVNSSVVSSMKGVIGIKTYFSENSSSFTEFYVNFKRLFRSEYPEEDKFEPGIHALKAHDAIYAIAQALKSFNGNVTSKMLLKRILSSNFTGLSGEIQFKYEYGELSRSTVFRVVNVVGKSYKELNYWLPDYGFSDSLSRKQGNGDVKMGISSGPVDWPGDFQGVPKGWVMPTGTKPMKIGVPGNAIFEKFVKVRPTENPNKPDVSGFCIDVFEAAVKLLNYRLLFEYKPFNGSYDDLVYRVHDKSFDAVVGDLTIQANRTKYVEFTQPFVESGLSLLVPLKSEESQKAWMFMKPFTTEVWLVTGAMVIYTMFIVCFLEHGSNPEFRGPWKNQIFTAFWFTVSTLFLHTELMIFILILIHPTGENVRSNFTKVVVLVWFVVVLVLNSNYTASLTSLLTVQRLEPTTIDVESLKKENAAVACDGDPFVTNYLQEVVGFNEKNIKRVKSENDFPEEFRNGAIKAAFIELNYQKYFLSHPENRGRYTAIKPAYRFGGFGFVFPQGSPIAFDLSEALLILSETGELERLKKKWSLSQCSNSTRFESEILTLHSFWGLFFLSGCTSTIVVLLYLVKLLRKFRSQQSQGQFPASEPAADVEEWDSSRWVGTSDTDNPQASPSSEIEMAPSSREQ